jgi:hypothetical protein
VAASNLTRELSVKYDIHKAPAVLNRQWTHSIVTKEVVETAPRFEILERIRSANDPEKCIHYLTTTII